MKGILGGVDDAVGKLATGVAGLAADFPKPPLVHLDLLKQQKKLETFYEDIKPIDEARFFRGVVYVARHKASGEYRCIRKVPKSRLNMKEFENELKFFKGLFHPNVVHLYETLEDKQNYYFVTDRVDHPNLYQAIPKLYPNPQDFDEVQVALISRTVLRALEFLHKHGLPHTNLSYYSILVPPKGGLNKLCIVGFAQARLVKRSTIYHERSDNETNEMDESSGQGRPDPFERNVKMRPEDLFAAPETRWGELSVFEEPSDIWSIGMITYQLLSKHHPYEDPEVRPKHFENKAWREDHFRNHKFLTNVSAPARDFLKQLLTYSDSDRPTATQSLKHEWLKICERAGGIAKKNEELYDRLDNLAHFDAKNRLEQASRLYMAANLLDEKEKARMDSIFKRLKRDGKDGMSKSALKVACGQAHGEEMSVKIEQMLESTFDRLDTEKKGVISYNQFVAAAADDSILLTKKNLRTTFDAIDKSKTGTLNVDDLKAFLSEGQKKNFMAKREAKRIIKEVDAENDGKEITFEDFCHLMKRKL